MDKIIIKDLRAHGIIGLEEWERHQPQAILINIVMFTDIRQAAASDDIETSVNYATVAEQVKIHAENAARLTVEALATDLAEICLSQAHVHKVQVRVEKPDVIPYVGSVGVEIERSN